LKNKPKDHQTIGGVMSLKNAKHLLLVDDDPVFRSLLTLAAHQRGIDIHGIESAMELDSVESLDSYDAAIVDYKLDGMTGVDLATCLKPFLGTMPVILVSSDANPPVGRQALLNCCTSFIPKALGISSIIDAVLEACERTDRKPGAAELLHPHAQ
jgi:DNA-binding NtrC family response regulator